MKVRGVVLRHTVAVSGARGEMWMSWKSEHLGQVVVSS